MVTRANRSGLVVVQVDVLVAVGLQVLVAGQSLELEPRQLKCVNVLTLELISLGPLHTSEAAEIDNGAELQRHLELVDS